MDEEPSDQDNALLARLNALKQSNVAFDPPSDALSITAAPSGTKGTPEDLIARFKNLYGRKAAEKHDDAFRGAAIILDDEPPSPTIDELLAELGPEDQYMIGDTDLKEANRLLAEAKNALPPGVQWKETESNMAAKEEVEGLNRTTTSTQEEPDEEAEAEVSLQLILDEAELEKQQDPAAMATSPPRDATPHSLPSVPMDSLASLVFPSTANIPVPPSLNLPSTPTTASSTQKSTPKSNEFSNEEIDSWCIICYANATVKCLGCDGDLYCWGCWGEGHIGEDVGLEEKNHVAERVTRRGNKKT